MKRRRVRWNAPLFLEFFQEVDTMQKKLYRMREGRVLAGVCGGIAEYFNLDPTLIRVIWAVVAATGSGILAYIICALIIPEKPWDDEA